MGPIVDLLLNNKGAVALAILALLIMLCLISDSLRGKLKKAAVPMLIVLGLGLGYYVITGKSLSSIPGDINRFFSDPHIQDEPSHKYYRDPVEDERIKQQAK